MSITIFSLVIGMAMFSLRYSFGVFRHLDAPFAEETRLCTGLRDCVASTFVYVGERADMFNRNKEYYLFFSGETDRMTFISTKPMAMTGTALCRLSLRDGAVVLEEAPLYADDSNYLVPSFETKEHHETVIFSHAKGLSLEYFQGEKRLSSLKEELPSLVGVTVTTDAGKKELLCRVQADYKDKKLVAKGLNEPL